MPSAPCDEDEAINLLSLDGGGVRGVSSLVILDEIMTNIQDTYGLAEIPKPCDFFHMIAGTSTGGLIAIMLGRLRMSTKEALQEYDNCAAKIFSSKNKKTWSLSERFRATALQEVVQGIVKARGMGELMRDPERPKKGKVVVCVMPAEDIGDPHFVRSFYGDAGIEDNWDDGVTIWEAARATTAASSFFKPQMLGRGTASQPYIDAAIGVNNPVDYLLEEAVKEFGSGKRLGCVVSIGTGTRGVRLKRAVSGWRNVVQAPVYYYRLINTLKSTATDGEETHRRLQARLSPYPGSYYRFNVPEAAELVKLHHFERIPVLRSLTAKYLASEPIALQVRQVAKGLGADDFDHGLTFGFIFHIDPDQALLSNKKAQSMGRTSFFFTGRQEILQSLDSYFVPRDSGEKPRREFLLYGMGGVGKTEIALKLSEALEDRFKLIFYIDGSSPVTILQSYASIARQNGLTGVLAEDLRTKALRWMEGLADEWLMIFDDCKMDDRKDYLPGRGKGNILYTSRLTSLAHHLPVECTYEVTPFEEADALDLLSKASGVPETSEDPADREAAQDIVRELGCLPLAVEKAAAFIRDGGWPLQDYLLKLREEKLRILSDTRFKDGDIENLAVYATLELSFKAIEARRRREGRSNAGAASLLALKVLNLLGFFHHKEFPSLIMKRAAEEYHTAEAHKYCPLSRLVSPYDRDLDALVRVDGNGKWDPTYFSIGVSLLQRFSLVKLSPDEKSVSMHVLVHTWVRNRMEEAMTLRWALIAKVLLIESLDKYEEMTYKLLSREVVLPHIEVCFAINPPLDSIRGQYHARLLHKMGVFYRDHKRFLDAERSLSQSLRIWKMELPDCWAAIYTSMALARLYHEMGSLSKAELMYLEAIEMLGVQAKDARARGAIEFEHQGEPSTQPASRLSRAGAKTLLRNLSEESVRRPLRGLSSRVLPRLVERPPPGSKEKGKEVEKPYDPNTPDDELDEKLKRFDRLEALEAELELIEAHDGLAHAELATVYMDQGRSGVGRRMLLQAVGYLEERVEKYDPHLMRFQIMARALTDAKDRLFWSNLLHEVLDAPQDLTLRFWQSEASLDLLIATASSFVLHNKQDWDLTCYELLKSYDAGIKLYSPSDRKILKLCRRIVESLDTGGKYDTAVSLAAACLRVARSTYGELHMETIEASACLVVALFYQKLELAEEDRSLLRAAVDKARAGFGAVHPLTLKLEHVLKLLTRPREALEPVSEEGLDPEAAITEGWLQSKATLESMRVKLGPRDPVVQRLEFLVGDGPAKSTEELLERARAGVGPHNSLTKNLEMQVEMKRAALAQDPVHDHEPETSAASIHKSPESTERGSGGQSSRQPQDMEGRGGTEGRTARKPENPRAGRAIPENGSHAELEALVLKLVADLDEIKANGAVDVEDNNKDANWLKLFGSRVRREEKKAVMT